VCLQYSLLRACSNDFSVPSRLVLASLSVAAQPERPRLWDRMRRLITRGQLLPSVSHSYPTPDLLVRSQQAFATDIVKHLADHVRSQAGLLYHRCLGGFNRRSFHPGADK
jgi:hypothetical protein